MHVLAAVKSLRWPETGDEYEIIGGFRGEPVELVESETIPGLMVPATAEWVIEGEFISEDYTTPVSSEDLVNGFVWGEAVWPVFKVKCITHRENPLWTATTFSSLGSKDRQGNTLGAFVTVIQLEVDGKDKPHPGYGEEVGKVVAAKYTVVVGPDIDIYNPEEVLWAIGLRAGRSEWHDYPPNPPGTPPNPHYGIFSDIAYGLGYFVIDATIPAPGRFDTFAPRTEPPAWEEEAIKRMSKKIDKLG
jgi:3-polyprenyl-4-hydroxybenzoate decarboxylase